MSDFPNTVPSAAPLETVTITDELPPGPASRVMGGRRTVAILVLTQACVSISIIAVWKLAVLYWGPEQLGAYLLTRRVINVLQMPLACITQLGLIRYGSMAHARGDRRRADALLFAGALIAGALALATLGAINAWPDFWATWLFGLPGDRALVFAGSLATVSLLVHSVAWSELWTRMSVAAASALLVFTLGIAPLGIFLIPHQSVASLLIQLAVVWLIVNGAVLAIQIARIDFQSLGMADVRLSATQLLKYGLPRAPGGLASAALFSAPVILASHFGDLLAASFIGTGVALLTMATIVTKPFTQAVLPTTSRMLAAREFEQVRRAAWNFLFIGVGATVACVSMAEIFLPSALTWYLGSEFAQAAGIFRMLLLAAVPYILFILLRDFLDALDERPLNSRNQLLALAVFIVLAWTRHTVDFIAPALAIALSLLAAATVHEYFRTIRDITSSAAGIAATTAEAA